MQKNELELLISKYEGVVFNLAKKLGKYDYEDFVQEGYLALMKAIKNYDKNKCANMFSYIYPCVKGAMLNFRNKNLRKFKELIIEDVNEILNDIDEYELIDNRIELDNIARKTKLTIRETEIVKRVIGGETVKQIADEQNKCLKTTSTMYRRGINKLKGEVKKCLS